MYITSIWLGVIGGGQLGRMFAHAAQTMGFKVVILDQQKECPAGQVADLQIYANDTNKNGLYKFGTLCNAITIEHENVSIASLSKLQNMTYVTPSILGVSIAQNRMFEKHFFVKNNQNLAIKPAPHCIINSISDIQKISPELLPGILKTTNMGYDGKGQTKVLNIKDIKNAFIEKPATYILEKMLPVAHELSVLLARNENGITTVYPIAENIHRNHILFKTTVPALNIPKHISKKAIDAALFISLKLNYVGILCVEFFVLKDETLIINEIAPRTHNSGHYTINACTTSQFEQQVRIMMHLPLGDVRQHSAAIMLNLLGDIWFNSTRSSQKEPDWNKILNLSGAHLHLYGKQEIRLNRKMGHITFTAATILEAQTQFKKACAILKIT